ncbi:MAG: tetratricopeptide repeat protein [Candidatus Krumholzibacteriota bacterium]|nr:tetratricopeptide repeat protein [Candidatus Krumholzibacteriota bacterium]
MAGPSIAADRLFCGRQAGFHIGTDRARTPLLIMNPMDYKTENTTTEEAEGRKDSPAAAEYTELLERMRGARITVELLIEAGELAAETGEREAARRHFQEALDLEPFHGRVRQAIRRRFSTEERREFRNIERPPAVWDDLGELVMYPFARGYVHAAVPAGVVLVLSFIPFGELVAGMLLFLWGYHVVGSVVRGDELPPLWHRALADPLREIILPLGAALAVVVEYSVVFAGVAALGMMVEQKSDITVVQYISQSPFMLVGVAMTLLVSLPAVVTLIAFRENPFTVIMPQNVVRAAIALGSEYALTLFLILALAFPVAIIEILMGWVPVLGNVLGAAALAVAVPMAGLMLGKMLVRNEHKLARRR